MSLLIGAYGPDMGGEALGIAPAERHDDSLELGGVRLEAPSPSWVAVLGDRLAATLEGTGELAWFRRAADASGADAWVADGVVQLGGDNPCHAAFLDDDTVAVACYGDGAVIVVRHDEREPVQRLDGAGSGPLPAQEGPHAHHVFVHPDGRVITLDLGADQLHVHARRTDGLLQRDATITLPAGTGPRDLNLLPSGELVVLGEWSCALLVLEAAGIGFEIVQIVGLPGATAGDDQASAIGVSADSRFLYSGVRGANRIAVLAVESGRLRAVGSVSSGGDWPRHLIVDGELLHVANQRSDEVVTFRIADDGIPQLTSRLATPSPTCVVTTTPESLLG